MVTFPRTHTPQKELLPECGALPRRYEGSPRAPGGLCQLVLGIDSYCTWGPAKCPCLLNTY